MRYLYPVHVADDVDGLTVTYDHVPEMMTCGYGRAEALARAEDAPVSALSFYVDDNRPVPVPPVDISFGGDVVAIPALEVTKLALHEAMLAVGMSNVEHGRRLGLNEKVIRRLRDPLHRSHIGQVEIALRALGRRIVVLVEDFVETAEPDSSALRRAA